MWGELEDGILGGDLTAVLAYPTPAGGAVATPVAPIGLRDREASTVSFTTSLGFGRKLERIRRDPRVALAYHAREHGFASGPSFVLVQGRASFQEEPDRDLLEAQIQPASARFMGEPRRGPFWDRWLSAYYSDRIVVTVAVERMIAWPDAECAGEPVVHGAPLPSDPVPSQKPPAKGTGPRIDARRAGRRIERLPHLLLAHAGADGYPFVAPVHLEGASEQGLQLSGPLPQGARRAGLLAHRFQAQLVGLEVRQYTGWLERQRFAPHTERGFRAPSNKTLLLLANGLMARRGLKQARARAAA
jgi:hypothetical protein